MTASAAAVERRATITEIVQHVMTMAMVVDVEVISVVFYDLDPTEADAVPGETGADRIEVATTTGAAVLAAEVDPDHRVSFLNSTSDKSRRTVFHECTWRGRTVTILAVEHRDAIDAALDAVLLADVEPPIPDPAFSDALTALSSS